MKKIFSAVVLLLIFVCATGQTKFTDKRDGNVYSTMQIAGKIWMTENLRFVGKSGANFFDNDSNNINTYGVLYDWKTAVTVCPQGWRLPTGSDFQTLMNHVESMTSWAKSGPHTDAFGIQLGGMQDYEGTFSEMDESGYYWTSTEYDPANAEYFSYLVIDEKPIIDISRKEDIADIHGSEKVNKYSVRCLKE